MILKIIQYPLKVTFLLSLLILNSSLIAADTPAQGGQRVGTRTNTSTDSAVKSLNTNKPKASSNYIDPKILKEQRDEEEQKNKALREQNEIGILYSDQYRKQNNDDASYFEEEILKSQINDTGVFLDNNQLDLSRKGDQVRIQAIQEGVLADYKKDTDGKNRKILDFKNPIFFVSEGVNTFSYTNTMDLCSVINLGARTIDCLVYPESNVVNISSILRRGQRSDFFDQTGVNADFIIVRDDVFSQYKKGRGSLALAPDLDIMMYLNGDYLFMFANSMSNIFSFEHLAAQKKGNSIRVGYINQQSRVIFDRTLAKIYPNHAYRYQNIDVSTVDRAKENICNPTNIDVFIFFGGKLPDNLIKAMDDCSSIVNPLTLSDITLSEVVKLTDFFSVANVVGYYPVPSVINYLEIYIALERAYRAANGNNSSADAKINLADYEDKSDAVSSASIKADNTKARQITPATARERELAARRQRAEQLKKQRDEERTKRINELRKQREEKKKREEELLNKKKNKENSPSKWFSFLSFLNFSSKSDPAKDKKTEPVYLNQELIIKEDSLHRIKGRANSNRILGHETYATEMERQQVRPDNSSRVYITANTAIKTFGIRYVLLASRYAKRENVINVFDSIIKDYFLLRDNILTPDMSKFNISDIILGTQGFSVENDYHPALSRYPSYLLEQKIRKTPEQTIAIRTLSVNASNNNNITYPNYFGPEALTSAQMDILYTKARELNKRKEELAAIRIFQRDTINIDRALDDMRNGRSSSDSLLKATGLDYVNAIIDEQSVLTQGMRSEEKLSPEAMKELEKLVNPDTLPVPLSSAEDIKQSVENPESSQAGADSQKTTPATGNTQPGASTSTQTAQSGNASQGSTNSGNTNSASSTTNSTGANAQSGATTSTQTAQSGNTSQGSTNSGNTNSASSTTNSTGANTTQSGATTSR